MVSLSSSARCKSVMAFSLPFAVLPAPESSLAPLSFMLDASTRRARCVPLPAQTRACRDCEDPSEFAARVDSTSPAFALRASQPCTGCRHRNSRLGLKRNARRRFLGMGDELTRAVFPGTLERERAACLPGHFQRLESGHAQIVIQGTDGMAADDILRTRDRKSGDGKAARERFELHDAERVGPAREYEHVGSREMRGQCAVLQQSEK